VNVLEWVRRRLATPPAIYGLIVYEVLIVAASDHDPVPLTVLIVAIISLLAFYLAHSFAEALAGIGPRRVGAAIGHGFAHSAGMLYAAVPPTAVMIVCIAAGTDSDTASEWSLAAGLVVLAFLGYQAMSQRGVGVSGRLAGGSVAVVLGFIVIAIDYAVH